MKFVPFDEYRRAKIETIQQPSLILIACVLWDSF